MSNDVLLGRVLEGHNGFLPILAVSSVMIVHKTEIVIGKAKDIILIRVCCVKIRVVLSLEYVVPNNTDILVSVRPVLGMADPNSMQEFMLDGSCIHAKWTQRQRLIVSGSACSNRNRFSETHRRVTDIVVNIFKSSG